MVAPTDPVKSENRGPDHTTPAKRVSPTDFINSKVTLWQPTSFPPKPFPLPRPTGY
jgi:hypothetical protein